MDIGANEYQYDYTAPTNINEITAVKLKIKNGKKTNTDSFTLRVYYPFYLCGDVSCLIMHLTGADSVYLRFGPFTRIIAAGKMKIRGSGRATGKDRAKQIGKIYFGEGVATISAKNVDLTGMSDNAPIDIVIGDFAITGQVQIRDSDSIPFMTGFANTMHVTKVKSKNYRKKADRLRIRGTLAVRDTSINLVYEPVTITWADQQFTIAPKSFRARGENRFTISKKSLVEGGRVTAIFDFNKNIFNILIKKVGITTHKGEINFGLSFADFNETEQLTRP